MKSFLDRFRKKDGDEPEPADSAAKPAEAPVKTDNPAPSKSAAPKFAPPAKAAARPETKPAAGAAEPEAKPADEPLVLELGDFLHRIPAAMLKEGPHDLHAPLQFDLDGVAARVARGETTVPLSELHRQLPQIFRDDALIPPDQEVRFPWQKVLKLLGESNAAQAQGVGGETLAQKLHKRRVVRNIGSGRGASAVEAPADGGKAAAAVLRGTGTRGTQAGSWFTRTSPGGSGAAAPEPAAKAPEPIAREETAPAPPVEAPAPQPMRTLKLTLPPDPAEVAAAATGVPAPALVLPNTPSRRRQPPGF